MRSRFPAYLHPVAGRPLCWHTLRAVSSLNPPPARLVIVGGADVNPDLYGDLPIEVTVVGPGEKWRQPGDNGFVLVVDAAAPTLASVSLHPLVAGPARLLPAANGDLPLALWLPAEEAPDKFDQLEQLSDHLPRLPALPDPAPAFRVRTRADLGRVTTVLRDRLVRRLMERGATFLLPDTVLVDVDVKVGRDTVVYPGVCLEGQTVIGDESVIGPGCRIIDSWIGSGVELKGWNYISHTSVRNRAILEPYARKGYD